MVAEVEGQKFKASLNYLQNLEAKKKKERKKIKKATMPKQLHYFFLMSRKY